MKREQCTYNTQLLDETICKIANGDLRPWQWATDVNELVYVYHLVKLQTAWKRYLSKAMGKKTPLEVIFISGCTGTGKTKIAIEYAKQQNKSFCITSSVDGLVAEYAGEPVLILDNARGNFTYYEVMKVTDSYRLSFIKNNMFNGFIGDTVIITSSVDITDWFPDELEDGSERFYRRIDEYVKLVGDEAIIYNYNVSTKTFEEQYRIPNMYKENVKTKPEPSFKQLPVKWQVLKRKVCELNSQLG